jgi:hypothetical protein
MCKTSINVFIYTTPDRRLVQFLSLFYNVSSTVEDAGELRIWNTVEGSGCSRFKKLSKKPIERPGNKNDNSSVTSAGFCTQNRNQYFPIAKMESSLLNRNAILKYVLCITY